MLTRLHRLGFDERVRGSHHIFTRNDVVEILNLQPRGSRAKAYQVKQVRGVLISYGLASPLSGAAEDDEPEDTTREEKDAS